MHDNFSQLITRNDLPSFIAKAFATTNPATSYKHNWHIDLIADHLLACEKGFIKRLIINLPPRYLKSLIVNVAWSAWLLGHDPAKRIISASYSQSLATKHSLDTRLLLNSAWYNQIFPATQIASDQNEKDKFLTTKRGFRLATSVGGTLTGEGGNFLILDAPHNPAHMHSDTMRMQVLNWYEQVFASRLDDKQNGVIVLIMQRLHSNDLTRHLLEKNSGWVHLNIPALAERTVFFPSPIRLSDGYLFPERFPLHPDKENLQDLNAIKAELGNFTFSAQYQQNPFPADNGLMNRSWLKYYGILPTDIISTTQSWDTAIKTGSNNDYTVCTTWAETRTGYHLIDVMRAKLEFPQLRRSMISHAEKFSPDNILVEDKASGGSLIQDIRAETKLPVIAINPKLDKLARLLSITSLLESGKVLFPEKAGFMADVEAELLGFPSAPHDDIVDSITQYLNWIKYKNSSKPNIRRL